MASYLRFQSICYILLMVFWCAVSRGNTPDYMIDDFENGSLTIGVRGTAGIGSAPFIYSYEKDGVLSLTYTQPDGQSDLAWWEALSWSWSTVDVSAYYYFCLDVKGTEGGEDATVEFHYRDEDDDSQKPFIRLSEYKEISTEMQTINIPIEDFDSFDKTRAGAVALGFRYITTGMDSMQIDNIGLSTYPSEFFCTHSATAALSNVVGIIFKPHYPQSATPCSAVSMVYAVNGGSVVTAAMTASGARWIGAVSNLAHDASVAYHFLYNYGSGGVTPDYAYMHNSVIDHEKPTTPYTLNGVSISPSRIDLSWAASTDNVGVTGYKIYRNEVEIGSIGDTNYSAVGLTAGTTYSFTARAFDAAGNLSGHSGAISVATPVDAQAPSAPVSLSAVSTGPTTVSLTWNASTDNVGVEGYQIFRDGVYYTSSYPTNGLANGIPGATHTFQVLAYDRAMNLSVLSTSAQVTMPTDTQPPSVPPGLSGTPDGPCRILLQWNASTDNGTVAMYEIFRDGLLAERTEATQALIYSDPEATHAFMVRAVDTVGNRSDFSAEISVTAAAGAIPQAGSYASAVPLGFSAPPTTIYVTTNVTAPYPTGDWWSSLLQVRCSGMMPARPMAFYAKGWALEFSYPSVSASGSTVYAPFVKELEVQATGGSFPVKPNGSARVDGYGDFSVRTRIGNDSSYMAATLAHGSPYAYIRFASCGPVIACTPSYTVVASNASASYLVVRVSSAAKTHYALFAPSGTTWQLTSSQLITPVLPSGKDFLSVAILPNHGTTYDSNALEVLRQHAYAFITNTSATFTYQRTNAIIRSVFSAQTESLQNGQTIPLLGMLPHHWKNSEALPVANMNYGTPLGTLKLAASNAFTVQHRFGGIVPQFPEPADATWSKNAFSILADQIAAVSPATRDTYWLGKEVERLARVIPALDSAGLTGQRDILLSNLRAALTNMFTYYPEKDSRFFAYNPTWGALHGYNESYGSVSLISDNHFHYGMFAYSAAILGMYDPFFVGAYREVVDQVIRQYNNPSRDTSGTDPLPWMRCFDPWEGHCWASGLGGASRAGAVAEVLYTGEKSLASNDGPDQESTSEAMNAWAAMFLWGLVTKNDEFINMGAAGYTTEANAIREYWYDADQNNLPAGYAPTSICRLFGSKLDIYTWFSSSMDKAYGIQYILTGPHMTYQGYFRDYRVTDYARFKAVFGTEAIASGWKDIHGMYRCFFEPEQVLAEYRSDEAVNDGNTQANLYYWIHAMNSLGELNTEIYSDYPALVAFSTPSTTNFIAWNYTGGPITARLFRASDDFPLGEFIVRNSRTTGISTDADDDGDGLNNGEELTSGTDLFHADTDGDGANDGAELFAGFDPLDASSFFRFDSAKTAESGSVTFAWKAHAERLYRLMLYPSLEELSSGVNGSNLFQNVSGAGWVEHPVTLPAWTNGFLQLQVY